MPLKLMEAASSLRNTDFRTEPAAQAIQEKLYMAIMDRYATSKDLSSRMFDLRWKSGVFTDPSGRKVDISYDNRYSFMEGGCALEDALNDFGGLGDVSYISPVTASQLYIDETGSDDHREERFEAALKSLTEHQLAREVLCECNDGALGATYLVHAIAEYIMYDPFSEESSLYHMVFCSPLIGAFLSAHLSKRSSLVREALGLIKQIEDPFQWNVSDFFSGYSVVGDGVWYNTIFLGWLDAYSCADLCDIRPEWYLECVALKELLDRLNEKYHFYAKNEKKGGGEHGE